METLGALFEDGVLLRSPQSPRDDDCNEREDVFGNTSGANVEEEEDDDDDDDDDDDGDRLELDLITAFFLAAEDCRADDGFVIVDAAFEKGENKVDEDDDDDDDDVGDDNDDLGGGDNE
jgi:hypothetical protein